MRKSCRNKIRIVILAGIIISLLASCTTVPKGSVVTGSAVNLTGYGLANQTAFNFVKTMKTGSTYATEDKYISFPYEGYWGMEAVAEKNTVSLRTYSNLDDEPEIVSVTLSGRSNETILTDNINYREFYSLNLDSGVYRVNTVFAVNGVDITNTLYIFVDYEEAWLCEVTWMDEKQFARRRGEFETLMSKADFTSENILDWKSVTHNGKDFDNEKWAALSDTIIPKDELPEGYKVMLLHDWLCDNTAFDEYALDTYGTNREDYFSDYSGKYNFYDTRIGVCTDIAEAFMIMCRYKGIPCVTCANDGHRWNAVFINGIWYEMDLTNDMYHRATSEDGSEFTERGSRDYTAVDMNNNILEVNAIY